MIKDTGASMLHHYLNKLMKIHYYQICYSDNSANPFHEKVKIFDQRSTPYLEQREVFHFIDFLTKVINKNKNNFYALFSPKFLKKIPCSFSKIDYTAELSLKDHDVFLINTDPKMVYFFFNVWEQGEHFHPGLKKIVSKVASINTHYRNDILTTYYSNYFIANFRFWNSFIRYVKDKIKDIEKYADKDLYKSVNNHFAPAYVFILERLLSNFIIENKTKFKISQFKYTKKEILKTTTNIFDKYIISNYLEMIDKLDLEKSVKLKKMMQLINKKRIAYKNKTFFEKLLFSINLIFDRDILRLKRL